MRLKSNRYAVFSVCALLLLMSPFLSHPPRAAEQSPWSLRAALGWQDDTNSDLKDHDCSSTAPPALFGCVTGENGRPLGAYGGFSSVSSWQLGVAYRLEPDWRLQISIGRLGDADYHGNANFLGVAGAQPVSAELNSRYLLGEIVRDFDTDWAWATPWLSLGVGKARHDMSTVYFGFPGLSPNAATILHGGAGETTIWRIGAGVDIELADNWVMDFSVNYTDWGKVETDPGPASIIREKGTFNLMINGVETDMKVWGPQAGIRYRF